jgi:hypothetical protein
MNLYLDIDLMKAGAGQGVSGGRDSNKTARRVKREYDESFNRMPVGVMGGDGKPDDPDKGPRHTHSEEDSLDEELEEKRQQDNKLSAERNLIGEDEEDEKKKEPTAKSLLDDTLDALHSIVQKSLNRYVINPVEQQFFEEQGYTKDDIIKGKARFDVRTKEQYDGWLMNRMRKSMSDLSGEAF